MRYLGGFPYNFPFLFDDYTTLNIQKQAVIDPRIILTLTLGETTRTFGIDRLRSLEHDELPWSQKAAAILDNSDRSLTDLDLKQFRAVIQYGFCVDGEEKYSACAPLWVLRQQFDSQPGRLLCKLNLIGIPDLLALDQASAPYTPPASDASTVRTLIEAVANAGLAPFTHCRPFAVSFDSADSLLNAYAPADSFRIYKGGSRLAALQRLIKYTGCFLRFREDGQLHVFVPNTSGTNYDYQYALEPGSHTFFSKAYLNSAVIPNQVQADSLPGDAPAYSGAAHVEGYDLIPAEFKKTHYVNLHLTSNEEGASIAQKLILRAQMEAAQGYGSVPMNVGAEVYDYVRLVDAREGNQRTGNIGYLHRRYSAAENKWEMTFGFGQKANIRDFENELASTETGQMLQRLSARDLYAERIQTGSLDIRWVDPTGNIDLAQIGDTLEHLPDGATYGKIKKVHLDAENGLKIDSQAIYAAGYNPSTKEKGVTKSSSAPGSPAVGDLWIDTSVTPNIWKRWDGSEWVRATPANLDDVPNSPNYRRVKSTSVNDSGLVILDQIWQDTSSGTYGLVYRTDISAGHIKLSAVIDEGGYKKTLAADFTGDHLKLGSIVDSDGYAKVSSTEISSGKIKLYSGTVKEGEWYNQSYVLIDANVGITISAYMSIKFASGAYYGYIWENGTTLTIVPAAGGTVSIQGGFGITGYLYSDLIPVSAAANISLGNTTRYYYQLCAYNIYRTNEQSLDSLNDLEVIKAMKPDKNNPELIDKATIHPYLFADSSKDIENMRARELRQRDIMLSDLQKELNRPGSSEERNKLIMDEMERVRSHAEASISELTQETQSEPLIDTAKEAGLLIGAIKQLAA